MSPELETLDQLLGGPLSLAIIRRVFPDPGAFMRGIHGLLNSGDVRLFEKEQQDEVPRGRWRQLFVEGNVIDVLDDLRLEITDQGVKRIG